VTPRVTWGRAKPRPRAGSNPSAAARRNAVRPCPSISRLDRIETTILDVPRQKGAMQIPPDTRCVRKLVIALPQRLFSRTSHQRGRGRGHIALFGRYLIPRSGLKAASRRLGARICPIRDGAWRHHREIMRQTASTPGLAFHRTSSFDRALTTPCRPPPQFKNMSGAASAYSNRPAAWASMV
jgi:hypothetical protein